MDANQPTDQALVSTWPSWVRASRAAINSVVAAGGFGVTNLSVAALTVSLTVGTDLQAVGSEIVIITGVGASTLATILGGTDGQQKTFIFQDNNITFTDGLNLVDSPPRTKDLACYWSQSTDRAPFRPIGRSAIESSSWSRTELCCRSRACPRRELWRRLPVSIARPWSGRTMSSGPWATSRAGPARTRRCDDGLRYRLHSMGSAIVRDALQSEEGVR